MRTKCKPKRGIAAANKLDNPAMVNPAAANDTAVVTSSTATCRQLGHNTPANATTNSTMEPDLPAAVAVHPATANNANVPSRGEMVTTVGGGDSVNYGNSFILSLLLPPPPAAVEAPLLSFNFLDGNISATNSTVDGEITSSTKHAANTAGSVETTMGTATATGGASNHTLPPDSVQNPFHTPKKLNSVGGANTTVDHVNHINWGKGTANVSKFLQSTRNRQAGTARARV